MVSTKTDSPAGLGTHTWLVLGKAYKTFAAQSRKSIESLGFAPTDFSILEALLHKGPLPINTLGRYLFLTSGSITTAVDRVEREGLVERKNHPKDRRVVEVHLTETGLILIREAFREHRRHMDAAFQGLEPRELSQLQDLLRKAGKAVPTALE
jgi:MarR family 2-MHQ and catechol resistance regulon transcriptional repressor